MISKLTAKTLEREPTMANEKQNNWDWDVRVRERHMKQGRIDEKGFEAYLGNLPDLAEQCEPVTVPQPAIGGRED